MAVFATVSTIVISILFISFRTSKKSEAIVILKQNGDAAMSQMVRNIKYARSLDDPIDCTIPITQQSITVTSSSDLGQTVYKCPTDISPAIASNGASLIDTSSATIDACSFTCSQVSLNDPPTITIQYKLYSIDNKELNENQGAMSFQTSVTMRNYSR